MEDEERKRDDPPGGDRTHAPGSKRPAEPVETDPRFPSGRWTGFWLQSIYPGRQYMSLHLTFRGGKVVGSGSDFVGNFTVGGTYELTSGRCRFVKSYLAQHAVEYDGCNQNDGLWIWGTWEIRTMDRGGFHIWPHGEEDPTQKRLRRAKDAPADAEEKSPGRVLVPAIGE